ncbi:MAG: hypothetical protein QOH57_125, partial [Mycobacterium sp.]|nr:hypothetical protein [Mycobacterium sp.]
PLTFGDIDDTARPLVIAVHGSDLIADRICSWMAG